MHSWGACCFSRGADDDPGKPSNGLVKRTAEELAAQEEQRSRETVERHASHVGPSPSLLVYSIADLPCANASESPGAQQPRAFHVPPNTPRGVPVETESFVGELLWMQAPAADKAGVPEDASSQPYWRHFQGRRRLWELRIRGRFRRVPKGELCFGIALRDFNYNQAVARSSMAVKRLGLMLIRWKFYLSWGDRCEAARAPDAELSHLVTGLAGFDQIIVTPSGEAPPPLSGDLSGLGLERKKLGYEAYKKEVDRMQESINTGDTYTFSYWGPSRFIDAVQWQFLFGTPIPMAQFLEEWPMHMVLYELTSRGIDGRHLESQKQYFLDVMFWSTRVVCGQLPSRYRFLDAPDGLEEATSGSLPCCVKECGKIEGHVGHKAHGLASVAGAPRRVPVLPLLSRIRGIQAPGDGYEASMSVSTRGTSDSSADSSGSEGSCRQHGAVHGP